MSRRSYWDNRRTFCIFSKNPAGVRQDLIFVYPDIGLVTTRDCQTSCLSANTKIFSILRRSFSQLLLIKINASSSSQPLVHHLSTFISSPELAISPQNLIACGPVSWSTRDPSRSQSKLPLLFDRKFGPL